MSVRPIDEDIQERFPTAERRREQAQAWREKRRKRADTSADFATVLDPEFDEWF